MPVREGKERASAGPKLAQAQTDFMGLVSTGRVSYWLFKGSGIGRKES